MPALRLTPFWPAKTKANFVKSKFASLLFFSLSAVNTS